MKTLLLLAACALLLPGAETMTLTASDGVRVSGDYYPAAGKPKALILLFHQAGSNAGEYASIAPRLNAEGYSCLALDQRSGGKRWGRPNRTAQALGHEGEYLDALKDLEAALQWAKTAHGGEKLVVWGSSYSSSLVFLLAARHPGEIVAVLAFSPGEYFASKRTVRDAAAQVKAPVFVTSAQDAGEIREAQAILAAVSAEKPAARKVQFVPREGGVHGSSTLLREENPKGADSVWRAVLAFLSEAVG